MKLFELCEPIFQYVCRLNRGGRQGVHDDLELVRAEVNRLLASAKATAGGDVRLDDQFEKVRPPLIYFIDSMIVNGRSSIAKAWDKRRLAYDWQEYAGDEKFWDLLDETLNDPGEAAGERLAVFYVCLGLGFTGFYYGKTDVIKHKMAQVAARLDRHQAADLKDRICPEAYEGVDRRTLFERPTGKLVGIGIVVVGLVVVLFVMNAVLYRQASYELSGAFGIILKHGPAPVPAAEPATAGQKESVR